MKKQDKSFAFNVKNLQRVQEKIANYPENKQASAVLYLLDLAQRQNNGWLSQEIIEYVANFLSIAPIRVYEVASFYSMFNLKEIGKYHIQVCGTTPCWLKGSADIMNACRKKLGINVGETTEDKLFTLSEVECLGACINAPIVQINDDYFEDLTEEAISSLIEQFKEKKAIKNASQVRRKSSAPAK